MNEPFSIEVKFNVLHETGKGINVKILRATADYLTRCALIILDDDENVFNREPMKCHDKLRNKARKIYIKASELEKETK